jgi:hypothetical protein
MNERISKSDPTQTPEGVGAMQTILSVLAAAFGVSNARKRERDFKHGNASTFIIAGIVFTALFVLAIVGIVKLSLHAAGQ